MRRLAWSLCAVAFAFAVLAVVFLVLGREAAPPAGTFGFRGFAALFAVVFGTVGALVAARQPSNPIGWLLLAAGVTAGIQEAAQQYAIWATGAGRHAGAAFAAWLPTWGWVPSTASVVLALLLFSDGRLRSPRWRLPVAPLVLGAALTSFGLAFAPGPLENFKTVLNPVGIAGSRSLMLSFIAGGMTAYMFGIVAAAVSLTLRLRSARGEERLQMKWIALAASAMAAALAASFAWQLPNVEAEIPDLVEDLVVLSFALVPVAMGIAILRYRLYEIDLVINKALVYGVLAVFISVVYAAIVVGVGTAVGTRGSAFLSAVAAAVIALAFQPVRRRVQRLANRVVYGERATPYEVLSGFSGRLAETYSVEDVLPRLARVLAEGIGATKVAISLGSGGLERTVASYPETANAIDDERAFEVRHQGELLGRIFLAMPPNEALGPAQEKLVADVAAQAGLVLRNAALIEDLRASRQRLVAAQDEERRRIERNIHDGAQQQLVALAVKLKLADSLVGKDEERAHGLLAELHGETSRALEDLRDLARGIYPPLLADKGLAVALEGQARKSSFPITVASDGIGRYPQEVESAVYFSCLEALQNVTKYADASGATIRLEQAYGSLTFAVTDDGVGFDLEAASRGTGLQGIADRLAALGGDLTVRSAPGAGTTLVGSLPVEATR